MVTLRWVRRMAATILAAGALLPHHAMSQVPARFYWKSLSGGEAVPLVFNSMSGNANPFDPARVVSPAGVTGDVL